MRKQVPGCYSTLLCADVDVQERCWMAGNTQEKSHEPYERTGRCFFQYRMLLESNLFSLSQERLKEDLSMSCKYVLKKQDTGDRTIPVAEEVLGADSGKRTNSDK